MTEARGIKRLAIALRRRRTVAIMVAAGALGVGALVVGQIPTRYRAEAAVKVIDARPPSEYVQPSFASPQISDIVGERMKALRLHILNRPLLIKVAEENGLVAKQQGDQGRAVEELRDRFDFRVEGADTFTVSYLDENPERAQAVVNRLAQLFMEQENQELQGRADDTTKVLANSAQKTRTDLDQADQKLAEFRRQHYGALPEQQEENLRNLDQAQMEINILETTLQSALDRRRHLLENDVSPLRRAEDDLSGKLESARSQYTPTHPEVTRLADEYQKVRAARLVDEQKLRQQTLSQNPEVLSVGTEVNRLRGQIGELRKKQAMLRTRVDQTAKNQQAMASLSLDRDVVKDKYTQLQSKVREAQVSQAMARDFRPYRFSILEPAARPLHGALPNRPLLAVAALLMAILLSLGTALGLELWDPAVRDATDIEQVAPNIAVLAAIPRIARNDRRAR